MTEDELRKWFDEIAVGVVREGQTTERTAPGTTAANRFLADAESAIQMAFPAHHPIRRQWGGVSIQVALGGRTNSRERYDAFHRLIAIFDSAHAQLMKGRRGSFANTLRVAAENDLLGSAEELLDLKFPVAVAAVVAGGALEIHLKWMCTTRGLTPTKDQIEPYRLALDAAEKAAPGTGLTVTDGKLVIGWGGLRNDAAHDPVKFSTVHTVPEVRAMITQVREFIARTT